MTKPQQNTPYIKLNDIKCSNLITALGVVDKAVMILRFMSNTCLHVSKYQVIPQNTLTTFTEISKTNTLKYNAILHMFLRCGSVVHELIC
jgi:hypothetical protein